MTIKEALMLLKKLGYQFWKNNGLWKIRERKDPVFLLALTEQEVVEFAELEIA